MEFCSVGLCHREAVEEIRARAGHVTSSHAFSSLFLWRRSQGLTIAFRGSAFLVKKENGELFFPCGEREAAASLFREARELFPQAPFRYVRKEELDFALSLADDLTAVPAPEDREYLYDRDQQIAMPGKRFTYQRAKCNKARRLGVTESRPLTADLLKKAEEMAREWASRRKDPGDLAETLEALFYFDALGLSGNMLFCDGAPVGFQLGSYLTPDTFDIHIAKTLVDDVDTLMKWELYRTLPESVVTINREEDLGIPGLALHKADAKPSAYHEFYRLSAPATPVSRAVGHEI